MKYTVVLYRPDNLLADSADIYVANRIEANSLSDAISLARAEVFKADQDDGLEPGKLSDYELCVLFEGHLDPKLFGWQSPKEKSK